MTGPYCQPARPARPRGVVDVPLPTVPGRQCAIDAHSGCRLETPFALIGTVDEIAGQLRQRREELGFSFITVHEPYMTTFGPVIERLRNEPG
jgi:hypothetical protein